MKMATMGFVLTVFLFYLSGTVASGAEVAKIGVVDLQRIIDTSNAGKRSAAEIKTRGREMEKILRDKEAEVEELKEALEQKSLVMNSETREKKERGLRIKMNDLKSLRERYLDTLKELNMKLSNNIKTDVFKIVKDVGKRDGYLLILERHVGGIVYAPNAIDITDRVIKEYNGLDERRRKEESAHGESKKDQ